MKKTFPQKTMIQLAYSSGEVTIHGKYNERTDTFEDDVVLDVVYNEQCDTNRWNSVHDLVFVDKSTGIGYHVQYEQGLTESQLLSPFYYDKEGVECDEVKVWEEQVTYTEIKWELK